MSRGRSPALFSFFTLIKKYSMISSVLCVCAKGARSIIFQITVISRKQNANTFFPFFPPANAKAMLKKTKSGRKVCLTGRLVHGAPTGVVEM